MQILGLDASLLLFVLIEKSLKVIYDSSILATFVEDIKHFGSLYLFPQPFKFKAAFDVYKALLVVEAFLNTFQT